MEGGKKCQERRARRENRSILEEGVEKSGREKKGQARARLRKRN